MNFSDALTSYTAELVDIMQEVQAKLQRVNEIKSEIDKLKQVETKATKTTKTTDNNNKVLVNVDVLLKKIHGTTISKLRNI
jgi:hypothetical protein